MPRELHIDGLVGTKDGGSWESGRGHAPFYVYDADLQKNVAGPYPVKWMARLWIAIERWKESKCPTN